MDYTAARLAYTERLKVLAAEVITSNDRNVSLKRDLHRDRALMNLTLHHFDEALSDALAALWPQHDPHPPQNAKAYNRAARVAYDLRRFAEAEQYFKKQAELLSQGDKALTDCQQQIAKTKARLHEENRGTYNITAMMSNANAKQPYVDAADFFGKVEVRDAGPGRGRGLFATRNIGSGDIVMVEKALCMQWAYEKQSFPVLKYYTRFPDRDPSFGTLGLWKEVSMFIRNNPTQAAKVLDLHGDYSGLGKDLMLVDDMHVVDSYQVHDIVASNAFGVHPLRGMREDVHSHGLFVKASYMNHSCLPNARRLHAGDMMIITANKNISQDDEITISYDGEQD